MTLQKIVAAFAAAGGVGGLIAFLRARAQSALDRASARRADAEAEALLVDTARDLVAEVRAEMDRRVSELDREMGRLRGLLEAATRERDELRTVERQLREENRQLRERIDHLEASIAELTEELARTRCQP